MHDFNNIFNKVNLRKLFEALKKEPCDIVLFNIIRYFLKLKPLTADQSLLLALKRPFVKFYNFIRYRYTTVKRLTALVKKPKISVVVLIPPRYPNKKNIDLCCKSLLSQKFELQEVIFLNTNNHNLISAKFKSLTSIEALNEIIEQSESDYFVITDSVVKFHFDAFVNYSEFINANQPEWFYTDHWEIHENKKQNHYCKPSFNLDYFLSFDFIKSPLICSKRKFKELGQLSPNVQNNHIYNLILNDPDDAKSLSRLMKFTNTILYSQMVDTESKQIERKKLVEAYIKLKDFHSTVESTKHADILYINRELTVKKKVSIIIPFKDQLDLTKNCVNSIIEKTSYTNYEILLISNNSKSIETIEFGANLASKFKNIKFYEYNVPFNFSEINNWAVKKATGEWLLFLNNDTEVINSDWLVNMCKHIQRIDVGAVGALLLYSDKTVQHAGVVLGIGDVAGHAHRFFNQTDRGYMNRLVCDQEFSAVTAACLLTKKKLFTEIGEFDSVNLSISNNDVDLCLRIRENNLRVIFTPQAKLFHFESKSRSSDLATTEQIRYNSELRYMKKYNSICPFYNEQLTRKLENFTLK